MPQKERAAGWVCPPAGKLVEALQHNQGAEGPERTEQRGDELTLASAAAEVPAKESKAQEGNISMRNVRSSAQ